MTDTEDDDIFDGDSISEGYRRQQQREYESNMVSWMASLSPDDRRILAEAGIEGPDYDVRRINGKRNSVEDLPFGERDDYDDDLDESGLYRSVKNNERLMLLRCLIELCNSENIRLKLDVMLFALHAYVHEGLTNEALAKRHGVSKQRFNILVNKFIDAFDLPPPPNGRSVTARIQEGKQRCQKQKSLSPSQLASASYTPAFPVRQRKRSETVSTSAA